MKTLKTLIIFALVLFSFTANFGQTGTAAERFTQAKEAFDNSQFEKTLTLLDAMEKDFGKSPRIESLRALTLRDLNRPRDAYLSVLAYFKLVEGKDFSGSAAHQSLVELRDTLKARLETDLSVKKDNLQAERNANADKAISETETRPVQSTQSSTTADPLAELEMWNKVKTSTNANDYYLFLMRFPAGSFAKQASAKMKEIGDPVWNEVKRSKDPFVYRDFISKNPNSPFAVEAKETMNMLAASVIAWEQIKDTKTLEQLITYVKKYPFGSNTAEANQFAITITQRAVQNYFPAQGYDNSVFSNLKFTNSCEIAFSVNYTGSLERFETLINLTEGDWSPSLYEDSDQAGIFGPLTIKVIVYKDKKFTKIKSTSEIQKNGFTFYLSNKKIANDFQKDFQRLVEVCKAAGR